VNQLWIKPLLLNLRGFLNCGKRKRFSVKDFAMIVFSSAQVGDWIMKPELSTAHLGIEDRDLVYEQKYNYSPILFI
jgi:hypothetical protein